MRQEREEEKNTGKDRNKQTKEQVNKRRRVLVEKKKSRITSSFGNNLQRQSSTTNTNTKITQAYTVERAYKHHINIKI
jgi:hypothetical protein